MESINCQPIKPIMAIPAIKCRNTNFEESNDAIQNLSNDSLINKKISEFKEPLTGIQPDSKINYLA